MMSMVLIHHLGTLGRNLVAKMERANLRHYIVLLTPPTKARILCLDSL
jgi:hypothetical protein